MSLYFDSIDKVSSVFHEYQSPKWSLYSGKGKASYPAGKTAMANLIYNQKGDLDLQESWVILRSKLDMLAPRGGYGHLYLGDAEDYINVPLYFPHLNDATSQYAGNMQMQPGIQGLPAYGNATFAEAVKKEMELYELRREVEDIKNARIGSTFIDRVGESLLENGQLPVLINGLIALVSKMGGQPIPQMQTAIPVQAPQDNTPKTSGVQGDPLQRILLRLGNPQQQRIYLEKLALLMEHDAEAMKQLLDQSVQLEE